MANVAYLHHRCFIGGVRSDPIIAAIAHLLLVRLQSFDAHQLAGAILSVMSTDDDRPLPAEEVEMLLLPILDRTLSEMQDVCSSDCQRFLNDRTVFKIEADPVESYWGRFGREGIPTSKGPERYLILENTRKPCNIGMDLVKYDGCPLFKIEPQVANLTDFLHIIETVSRIRIKQDRGRRAS